MYWDDKITFLVWSINESLLGKYMLENGANVKAVYKGSESKVINIIRMLWFKVGLSKEIWFRKKNRNMTGIIVIMDAMIIKEYLKWIVNNNPKARVIFCYWNPIALARVSIETVKNAGCEVWSYGFEQCNLYQIKQNAPFYCESMYREARKYTGEKEYDIMFAGKDKGRLEYLESLMKKDYWKDLKWNIYISPDHFWQIFKKKIYKLFLPYNMLLCQQIKSRAVLELVPSDLKETTMRTIDAMCLQQKLITNNTNIINMIYYNKNNIFVMGIDKEEDLQDFLHKPFSPIPYEIWNEYTLDKWIERFINDKPINECTLVDEIH